MKKIAQKPRIRRVWVNRVGWYWALYGTPTAKRPVKLYRDLAGLCRWIDRRYG